MVKPLLLFFIAFTLIMMISCKGKPTDPEEPELPEPELQFDSLPEIRLGAWCTERGSVSVHYDMYDSQGMTGDTQYIFIHSYFTQVEEIIEDQGEKSFLIKTTDTLQGYNSVTEAYFILKYYPSHIDYYQIFNQPLWPDTMKFRIVEFPIKGGGSWVFIDTLFEQKYSLPFGVKRTPATGVFEFQGTFNVTGEVQHDIDGTDQACFIVSGTMNMKRAIISDSTFILQNLDTLLYAGDTVGFTESTSYYTHHYSDEFVFPLYTSVQETFIDTNYTERTSVHGSSFYQSQVTSIYDAVSVNVIIVE